MGSVLDEAYKVNGAKQLRAVDSSTFEESQGTKPTATVLRFSSSYNFDQKKKIFLQLTESNQRLSLYIECNLCFVLSVCRNESIFLKRIICLGIQVHQPIFY